MILNHNNSTLVQEFESKAKELGITMPQLFRKAGVAPAQFYRWKHNQTSPTYLNIRKIRDAIATMYAKNGIVNSASA